MCSSHAHACDIPFHIAYTYFDIYIHISTMSVQVKVYQCVCVCHVTPVHESCFHICLYFISHCACHFLGSATVSQLTAMGNGPRDSLRGSRFGSGKMWLYWVQCLYSIMLLMEEILYPVDMPTIPQLAGFDVSQLVQDLFHEVYFDGFFFGMLVITWF